jgi:hypothetical protein
VSCARSVSQKNSKSTSRPELKPVDVADVFGNSQIKRTAPRKDEKEMVRNTVVLSKAYKHVTTQSRSRF